MPLDNKAKAVVASIITAVVSGSLSYAVAQAKMCGDVREDNIRMKADLQLLRETVKDNNVELNNRVDKMVGSVDKLVVQNTELITLIRLQNQIQPRP